MSARYRTAHPYRDLDVIDARAPRFNQATVGVVSLVAVLTGWWALLGLLALQLGIGLRYGRQYCLPCVAYFELVQPASAKDRIEDSRLPRFANQSGSSCSSATLAYAVGLTGPGRGLGLLVAGLALLAATTGFCAGCEMYRIGARLRGIRRSAFDRVELADLGVGSEAGSCWCSATRSAPSAAAWRRSRRRAAIRSSASTCAIGPTWRASTASRSCRPSRGGRRDRAAAGRRLTDIRRQG